MNKKTLLAISLLASYNLKASGEFEHHAQPAASAKPTAPATTTSATSHIVTSTQGVSASSDLIAVLQDISSTLSSSSNASALTTVVQQLNTGATVFDINILEQALQEALGILATGGGLNAFTVIEYTGILVETIVQLEAARATSSAAATSTVVTTTTH